MGTPVVVVSSGGLPITVLSSGGIPMEIASNGRGLAVTVVSSGGLPVTGVVTGPDVTAPIITSSSTISQPENAILTHYLTANELPVTWAKVGGADTAKFTLVGNVLTLPAKDYEAPDDADTNRTYIVQVQATDAASNVSTVQTITVTITDVSEGGALVAPTLTLAPSSDTGSLGDNITDDTTPDIDVTPGTPILVGDVITMEIDDNSGFTSPVTITNTIDSGEAAAGSVTETMATLTGGTWYWRAKHTRGVDVSAWSTTLSIVITVPPDTTAPILSAPGHASVASTSAALSVTTNEANGTLYASASASAPSKAQIKAGQTSTGAASSYAFNQAVSGTGVQNKSATGLTASTSYTMHYMHEDSSGNQSNIASDTAFTTLASGTWTSPLDASTPAVFWVDASNASTITTTGAGPFNVSQWNDLGTGAHNLTPSGTAGSGGPEYTASGILNGKAGIAFAGGADLWTAVFTIPQPFMLVMVWKMGGLATSPYGILFDGDRTNVAATRAVIFSEHGGAAPPAYAPYAGTLVGHGSTAALNTAYHSRVVFNGGSSSSVWGASSLPSISLGTGGVVNGIKLGHHSTNTPKAYICEAFIIPNPTAGDATAAAAYTLAKWTV